MKWSMQRPSGTANHTVNFPNVSRSYDATRSAVRFWGYDRAMENSFFVTSEALRHIQPNLQSDEEGLLLAFDQNRNLIYEVAARVFARGHRDAYNLVVADF